MLYGREIPDYRTVRDNIDRLIAEGERNRQARAARQARTAVSGVLEILRSAAQGRRRGAATTDRPLHAPE